MQKIILKNLEDTQKLAQRIAQSLRGGEVIALVGDLGAGKTTFTKALVSVFGVDANKVTSPTFVLMKEYLVGKKSHEIIKKIIHIDAYRLPTGQALLDIGVSEYFDNPETVTVIEWADRVADILPKNTIRLEFTIKNDARREVTIKKRPS
jgi:tRNA threonylcarbamoyladenosine biosynthesis protein TsaE